MCNSCNSCNVTYLTHVTHVTLVPAMPLVRLVCPHWTTVPLSRRAVALAICLLLGTWSVMGESVQQPTLANGSSGGSLALPKSSLAGKPFSIQQQGEGA